MNRIYIFAALTAVCVKATAAPAANGAGGLSRQVEVTKEYVPEAASAERKVDFDPQVVDTTTLRPEMEYSIRPSGYVTRFNIPTVTPLNINISEYKYITPYYLKFGGGYPLNGLLDFYWSQHRDNDLRYGAYYNHDGRYGKATTDLGQRRKALTAINDAGAFIGREFGRYSAKANIDMFFNEYTAYGSYAIDGLPLADYGANDRFNYKGVYGRFVFGDQFVDMSHFNFRVGGRLGTMANTVQSTDSKGEIFGEAGKSFDRHTVILAARWRRYFGVDSRNYFTVEPRYGLDAMDFRLTAGLKMAFGHGGLSVFPQLNLKYDIWGGYVIPFAEIDGGLVCGDMEQTVALNPYVANGATVSDMREYNLRAGVVGSLSSRFTYRVFAGVNLLRDISFFASDYAERRTARFVTVEDNCARLVIGGEIEYVFYDKLRSRASAHYYGYSLDRFERAGGMPNFDLKLGLCYDVAPKWRVDLGSTLLGRRYFFERAPLAAGGGTTHEIRLNKALPSFGLDVEVNYDHSRMYRFFLRGENLCNSKLYPYNHYRSVGPTVIGGVRLSF